MRRCSFRVVLLTRVDREAVTRENFETEKLGVGIGVPEGTDVRAWAFDASLNSSVRSIYAISSK